jgi:hypothetical protein
MQVSGGSQSFNADNLCHLGTNGLIPRRLLRRSGCLNHEAFDENICQRQGWDESNLASADVAIFHLNIHAGLHDIMSINLDLWNRKELSSPSLPSRNQRGSMCSGS